jgi:hypothetical protein
LAVTYGCQTVQQCLRRSGYPWESRMCCCFIEHPQGIWKFPWAVNEQWIWLQYCWIAMSIMLLDLLRIEVCEVRRWRITSVGKGCGGHGCAQWSCQYTGS